MLSCDQGGALDQNLHTEQLPFGLKTRVATSVSLCSKAQQCSMGLFVERSGALRQWEVRQVCWGCVIVHWATHHAGMFMVRALAMHARCDACGLLLPGLLRLLLVAFVYVERGPQPDRL